MRASQASVVVVNNKIIKIKIETFKSSCTQNNMKEEHPIVATATRTPPLTQSRKRNDFNRQKTKEIQKRREEKKKQRTHTEDEQIKEQPIQREVREDEAEK